MAKLIILPNGMKICYEQNTSSLACAFGVFVGAGSRNENKKENGIAHFIEHMTFKGTTSRTAFQIADETDMMGANCNAFTSKTSTVYYITGLTKFAEKYVEILGDLLFCSTYTEENIEKERGVVLEEIHMYDDDADSLCSDLLSKIYFGKDSSLSRPILGTAKTVSGITRADILSFREKWYRPENLCIVFVGNISEDTLLCYIDKYFTARMPLFTLPYVPFVADKVEPNTVYKSLKKPFEQATVMLRFPSPAFCAENRMTIPFLANMLGGGMSSRLFQKVREEMGLAYEIYSANTTRLDGGEFDIYFATSPKTAEKATQAVASVVREVVEKGFSATELTKSLNQFETSYVLSDESTYDRMRILGRNIVSYRQIFTNEDDIERIHSVSRKSVQSAIETILTQKPTVAYVGKDIGCDLTETYSTEK